MIRAYTGLLGAGKTLSMINDTQPLLAQGLKVFTNTPFSFTHKKVRYLPENLGHRELEKAILTETNAVFCIDEAAIVFPNQFWSKLPADYLFRFAQSRKYGLHFFYTTRRLNHTVKRLRDLTNVVVKVRKITLFGRFDFYENIYYDPEHFGLEIVAEIEYSSGFYEFDTRVVWKQKSSRKCFTARDSGCSCPIPFEDYHMGNIEPLNFQALRQEVNDELTKEGSNITAEQAQDFLAKVRAAAKQIGRLSPETNRSRNGRKRNHQICS